MATMRRIALLAAVAVLTGCGSGTAAHLDARTARPAAPRTVSGSPSPPAPPAVALEVELPLIGLSGAPTVRYVTTAARPAVRGTVHPAGATVYMLSSDGSRTAVNPRADGTFTVYPRLMPGPNALGFTAAWLGARPARASVVVTWRGPGAHAMQRAIEADPAKYLPAASAGLNRPLPAIPNPPRLATTGAVAVTFGLDPIRAPAPPSAGGPGRWIGGFELTEYFPALEAWFAGRPVPAPGLPGAHRIDWLYSARGLSMEGDGIGLDGRRYHVADTGSGGWLTAAGRPGRGSGPAPAPPTGAPAGSGGPMRAA